MDATRPVFLKACGDPFGVARVTNFGCFGERTVEARASAVKPLGQFSHAVKIAAILQTFVHVHLIAKGRDTLRDLHDRRVRSIGLRQAHSRNAMLDGPQAQNARATFGGLAHEPNAPISCARAVAKSTRS